MLKKIMHFIILSCRKASELIEKKQLFKLSFREKIQLNMHTSICDACARYEKQSEQLNQMIKEYLDQELKRKDDKENKGLKDKIIKSL